MNQLTHFCFGDDGFRQWPNLPNRHTEILTDKDRGRGRQTDKQTDTQTDRQTDRQTMTQTDTETHTEPEIITMTMTMMTSLFQIADK